MLTLVYKVGTKPLSSKLSGDSIWYIIQVYPKIQMLVWENAIEWPKINARFDHA